MSDRVRVSGMGVPLPAEAVGLQPLAILVRVRVRVRVRARVRVRVRARGRARGSSRWRSSQEVVFFGAADCCPSALGLGLGFGFRFGLRIELGLAVLSLTLTLSAVYPYTDPHLHQSRSCASCTRPRSTCPAGCAPGFDTAGGSAGLELSPRVAEHTRIRAGTCETGRLRT